MLLHRRWRQHDDVAGAARRQREAALRSRRCRRAAPSTSRSRPISTRSRARCDSSACLARNARASSTSRDTSPGHASASARASANSTGRVASEITLPASRTTWRQASTTSAFDANSASTSSSRSGRSSPRAISRAAGVSSDEGRAFDFGQERRDAGLLRGAVRPALALRAPP